MPHDVGQATAENPLAKYLDLKIHLFIFDKTLQVQMDNFLRALKFTKVQTTTVLPAFSNAVQQLYILFRKNDDIIFVNPPLTVTSGKKTIKKDVADYFADLKRLASHKSGSDTVNLISKCVPIFLEANILQMREKVLLSLSNYGITGAFILKQQESLVGLSANAQKAKKAELMAERFNEVRSFLIEYLAQDKDQAVQILKAKHTEQELTKKKEEASKWMASAEEYKRTKNFEEAINCYKKAIEAMPQDPSAYMESGKTYVRIQKYSRALERFKQASDIAGELPAPNQEIGNLRIAQVKEKIAKGENPDSPEIRNMLQEAVANFEIAINKASSLKPLSPDDTRQHDKEAVSRVANDIFKTNLSVLLGPKHDAVLKLGALAADSMKDSAMTPPEKLHPAQVITLGLGALERGDFQEAERLLFISAANSDYFQEATAEINYFGTRLRREKGEDEAIRLYNRLLGLNPPNKAAVHFNLSVAWRKKDNSFNATGSIVKAIYLDPHLPKDPSFYQSPEVFDILKQFIAALKALEEGAHNADLSTPVKDYYLTLEKLEELIHSDTNNAMKHLYGVVMKYPAFFKNPATYCHVHIPLLMEGAIKKFSANTKPDAVRFVKFLGSALAYGKKLDIPQTVRSSAAALSRAMEILYKTADQADASYYLAQAIASDPLLHQKPDIYANPTLLNLTKEVARKLSNVQMEKLG